MHTIQKIFAVLVLSFMLHPVSGEKVNARLASGLIPEEVKKDADAVVRFDETTLNIVTNKKIVYHYHYAITVLHKQGVYHGYFREYYDKNSHIDHFSGAVYDSEGKRIRKISSSDLKDLSAVSEGTLYQDDRVKIFAPDITNYPVTIEYEYEKEYDGAISYRTWRPQDAYRLGVEKSSFRIVAGTDDLPRFQGHRLPGPAQSAEEGKTILTWVVSGLPPLRREPLSGDMDERIPVLYLAPTHFTFAKTKGDMSSWQDMGRWIARLNEGKNDLPPETVQKIKELTAGYNSTEEKARAVYRYMQKHTRYVSVQLGIGGYQPYPASYVDRNGYGDCKALSNYTCSLMQAAGIDARYVLIEAGNQGGDIHTDFPSNQFNHAIVCIPQEKDSIWLECTSQTQPFGFLGTFTADKHGLMITGDSGVLVHTPAYRREENTQYRHAIVQIDPYGNATARIYTTYQGLQYENVTVPLSLKGDKQKKWYYTALDIPNFSIVSIRLTDHSPHRPLPVAEEELEVSLKKYMTYGGKRAYLPVNLMNKSTYIPKQLTDRESDIVLTYPFTDADTITYLLPDNLRVEYTPAPVHIRCEFGEYISSVKAEGHKIIYTRMISLNKGRYPKEKFEEFTAFRKKIVKADHAKVLLRL